MGFWQKLFGVEEAPRTGGSLSFGVQLNAEVLKKAEVKPAEMRQTNADRLDALCAEFSAEYEIRRPDGARMVVLKLPSGDMVTGRGNNMAEALDEVERKVRQ